MTFITQGGEGRGKTNKKRKATKSKGRGLEEGASLWVDFGSRRRLHGPASPFGRCGTRVANPTPRQNEPQGEVPDR